MTRDALVSRAAIGVVHPAAVQMLPSLQGIYPQRRHVFAAAAHIVANACLSVWLGTRRKWRDRHQAAHGLFVLYEVPDRARLIVA